ncbi:hypothetical protein F0562_020644 [Nyssa sinensis]|uniref:Uncharacterized protein n=1 Tax=Nyssa sinensis TaxID=561372 RepID=A0A5J5BSC3_9ASTE|nr:hypothetical protein F0562_020644 [Nyssa sinensis]
MSTPIVEPQQQQPPPMAVTQQAYTTHSGHGSIGPVIAVLAVITFLGVIAGMIGRLCSGRRIMGHGQYYDFEGWVERKCSFLSSTAKSTIRGRMPLQKTRPVMGPAATPCR